MELSILDLNHPEIRGEIAANLRRLRQEKDLSQHRLARRCGISPNLVSRVESGDRRLELSLLVKLAEGLEEPVMALMPGWIERLLGVPLEVLREAAGWPGPAT